MMEREQQMEQVCSMLMQAVRRDALPVAQLIYDTGQTEPWEWIHIIYSSKQRQTVEITGMRMSQAIDAVWEAITGTGYGSK